MSKVFSECDWETDLPSIGTDFRFSKKRERTNKVKKTTPTVENGGIEIVDHSRPPGWSVRLPKPESSAPENNVKKDNTKHDAQQTVGNERKEGKKRKAPTDVSENGSTSKKKNKHDSEAPIPKSATNGKKAEVKETNDTKQKPIVRDAPKEPASLREKLMERLKGSRFRFINEQLYKSTGEQAQQLFAEDPGSFAAYHEGYRHQIVQWSMNPLDRMIKSIRKLPKNTIVADFGCGEARLAESLPNQVYSLDLVAHNSNVIACDMAHTPLESNFVNVVVFCLSLMGTNLADFLLEANRVLKVGGILKIAEVSSRFDNVNEFVSKVRQCGFELENKDLKHKLFYFFNFKKDRTVLRGSTKIKPFSLKPCLYKKR
ncbi:ribosomal RNA-processing protein 8 [Anopheles darlingi]|uniref:ribosomal RNA-processing protein 8 n=1 Tax=Anopheles darlingi TaxID=43151 RepID=UPI0021005FAF|nr:ribosomal RNA-processing protein 8 [Anopheles darlingi]